MFLRDHHDGHPSLGENRAHLHVRPAKYIGTKMVDGNLENQYEVKEKGQVPGTEEHYYYDPATRKEKPKKEWNPRKAR